MKKHRIHIAVAALVWMLALVMRAEAADGDSVRLDQAGTVTIVSGHAAQDKVCSLQLSLSVDAADAEEIEFQFQGNQVKVQEFRYDREGKKLTLYLAGSAPLFTEQTGTLVLGRVVALDKNGAGVSATVSVVADSLQYVYGTELKTVENVELPGTVQITGSARPAPSTPAPQPGQTTQPEQTPQPAQTTQPSETQQPSQAARPVTPNRPSQGADDPQGGDVSESGNKVQEGTESTPVPGDPTKENGRPGSGPGNAGSKETDLDGQELKDLNGIGTTQEVLVFAVVVALILIMTVVVTAVSYRIHRNSRRKGRDRFY